MDLIRDREFGLGAGPRQFCQALSSSASLYKRVALEDALVYHEGCVNDIAFNSTGDVLASGSDDTRICFWDVNSRDLKSTLETGHTQNIFSVKFVPETGDTHLASCAGDGLVQVHNLVRNVSTTFTHHHASVTEVETEPGNPDLMITSSDDCTVQQVDLRQPTQSNARILVNLTGPMLEISSISVAYSKPWLLAVGADDSTLRIYDRRKLVLENQEIGGSGASGCMATFTLPEEDQNMHRRSIGGVCFADNGSEVLANYIGDYVYLFDVDSQVSKTRFFKNVGLRSRRSSSTAGGPRSYGASHQTLDGVRSTENNEVSNAGAMEMDGEAEIVHGAAINDSNLTPTTLVPDVGLENRPQSLHQSPTPGLEGQSGTQLQSLENQEQQFSVETTLSNDNERFPELGASSDIPGIENAMEEEISNESDVGDLSPSLAAFIAQVNHGLRGAELTLALHHWDTETDSSFSRDGAGGRVVYDWGLMSDSGSSSGSDNESEGEGNEILDDLEDTQPWKKLGGILASGCAGRGAPRQPWSRCYRGHVNIRTIKSVSFLGSQQKIVAAGSDDGRMFLWDRATGHVVTALRGDRHTVNCIRSHPHDLLLASCGIDSTVKIWTPCLAAPKKRSFKWYKSLAFNEIQRRGGTMASAYGRGFYRQELLDAYEDLQGSEMDSMGS